MKSQLCTEASYFFNSFKQQLCIFSQKLSNENKQRLYKIQKRPTSLFYHVLLIKQNECTKRTCLSLMITIRIAKSCIKGKINLTKIMQVYHSKLQCVWVKFNSPLFRRTSFFYLLEISLDRVQCLNMEC